MGPLEKAKHFTLQAKFKSFLNGGALETNNPRLGETNYEFQEFCS